MLFNITTETTTDLGAVASTAFDNVSMFVFLIVGIVLGFFIIEKLISLIRPDTPQQREVDAQYGDSLHNSA